MRKLIVAVLVFVALLFVLLAIRNAGVKKPSMLQVARVSSSDVQRLRELNANLVLRTASMEAAVRRTGDTLAHEESRATALARLTEDVEFKAALQAYQSAVRERSEALDQTWSRVNAETTGGPMLIDEPLLLAFENLQTEVNERLGDSFRTEVSGLLRLSSVDLAASRLFLRYARAVTQPESNDKELPRGAAEIGEFNRELILLSSRQLEWLDAAVEGADQAVQARLSAPRLAAIRPHYLWLLAPIRLALLDSCKHLGALRCPSARWFRDNESTLVTETLRAGWPTGRVFLYNRRNGAMDGFALAKHGDATVDPEVLLRSLADPRSLGRGQCAIAGMIARGSIDTTPLGAPPGAVRSLKRYGCPSFACSGSGTGSGGPIGSPLPPGGFPTVWRELTELALKARWPELSDGDLAAMRSDFCISGTGDLQGSPPAPSFSQCTDALFENHDPYSAYDGCLAMAAGAETGTPGGTVFAMLHLDGLPLGPNCGLIEEEGGAEKTEEEKAAEEKAKKEAERKAQEEAKRQQRKEELDAASAAAVNGDWGPLMDYTCKWQGYLCPRTLPDPVTPAPAPPSPAPEPPAPEPAPSELEHDRFLIKIWDPVSGWRELPDVPLPEEDDLCMSDEACLEAVQGIYKREQKSAEEKGDTADAARWAMGASWLDSFIKRMRMNRTGGGGSSKGCFDPFSCDTSCTGVGRQVEQAGQCGNTLMDTLLRAAGRPSRSVERQRRPVDPRAVNPNPNEEVNGDHIPCLAEPRPGGGSTLAASGICGLVLCGSAAMGANTCCGLSAQAATEALEQNDCLAMLCTEDHCPCEGPVSQVRTYSELPVP